MRKTTLVILLCVFAGSALGALDIEYKLGADGATSGTTTLSRLNTRLGLSRFQVLSPAWSVYLGAGAGGAYELSADAGTRERLVPNFDATVELGWRNASLTTVAGGTLTSFEAQPRLGITWSPGIDLSFFTAAEAALPWAAADPQQYDGYLGTTVGMGPASILTATGGFTRRLFPAEANRTADTIFGELAPVWYLRSGWTLAPSVELAFQQPAATWDLGARASASGVGPGRTYLTTGLGWQWFNLSGPTTNRLTLDAELTRPLARGAIGTRAAATLDWSAATTDRTIGFLLEMVFRWSPLQS